MYSYSYLSDHTCHESAVDFHGRKLDAKAGFFSMLILQEQVTETDPLYEILSGLELKDALKETMLKNITSGILKIALEVGLYQDGWKYNFDTFGEWIASETPFSNGLPDIIILSHNHWTNYMGGIRYLQEKHPEIPVFLTTDMGCHLVCFHFYFDSCRPFWHPYPDTARVLAIEHPYLVQPGITKLTKNLILINQPSLTKLADVIFEDGSLAEGIIKEEPEYETIVAFSTGESVVLFVTCMHSSFFNVVKSAKNFFKKEVSVCFGACQESSIILSAAKELSPSLHCYFREFIFDEETSDYKDQVDEGWTESMTPGNQFGLKFSL